MFIQRIPIYKYPYKLFPKLGLLVPPKGQLVCPSKRATYLSLKKGKMFVPQKVPMPQDTLSDNCGSLLCQNSSTFRKREFV